ncbi:MAG: YihY/virulence factor BrkB family protein [Burkholderiales bacterium]|nr:YihY/virulence factor BrkB family protein [Anaerolineae bacterium]
MLRPWLYRLYSKIQFIPGWWRRRKPSTHALPSYIWRAIVSFSDHGLQQAAALAFYFIFSIFPLTLLIAIGLSRLLDTAVAQDQITTGMSLFLPQPTIELLQTNVSDALMQSSSFGIVAVVSLIWSGLGLFTNVTYSLDTIFRVPAQRSLMKQRAVAFGMALLLIVLVVTSFLTSGVLFLVSALLLDQPTIWITIGMFFLPLGLDMMIFALLFRYVPARRVHWDAVWPAAIIGATGWELLKAGFGWYLENLNNYQFVYGSIATPIVLLLWAYLVASIFLLSAELCAQLNEWVTTYHEREPVRVLLERPPTTLHLPPKPPRT